jgi:hypothetical protein
MASIQGGDTVLIEDSGVYQEKLLISRSILLMAATGETPTIRSDGDAARPYLIRNYDAAIGARIGSNTGGRITLDGNGDTSIYWLLSNRHTAGEVVYENLLLKGGHAGANSLVFPELRLGSTVTLNNVEIDAGSYAAMWVRAPDQVLNITRSVFDMSGTGSSLFLLPASGCSLFMDHCDILSENIGVRFTTPTSTPNEEEQSYIDQFVAYWTGQGQIPDSVPTLEEYATPENFDRLHFGSIVDYWTNLINTQQNLNAGMAWGSSYATHAYNDMFRATGDLKYFRANMKILEAAMANRDDRIGYMTFFGEEAPAWGTPYYAGRHVVHLVHTGMIATGVVEFLELVQRDPTAMGELGEFTFNSWVAQITESLDWHDREWINGPAADEGYYISRDEERSATTSAAVSNWSLY